MDDMPPSDKGSSSDPLTRTEEVGNNGQLEEDGTTTMETRRPESHQATRKRSLERLSSDELDHDSIIEQNKRNATKRARADNFLSNLPSSPPLRQNQTRSREPRPAEQETRRYRSEFENRNQNTSVRGSRDYFSDETRDFDPYGEDPRQVTINAQAKLI